jgi:hypothetical protein
MGTARAEGRASLYSLARPELMNCSLRPERLLETTGEAVAPCPTYGRDTRSTTTVDLPDGHDHGAYGSAGGGGRTVAAAALARVRAEPTGTSRAAAELVR